MTDGTAKEILYGLTKEDMKENGDSENNTVLEYTQWLMASRNKEIGLMVNEHNGYQINEI
mgnify:CR=1 FL=1